MRKIGSMARPVELELKRIQGKIDADEFEPFKSQDACCQYIRNELRALDVDWLTPVHIQGVISRYNEGESAAAIHREREALLLSWPVRERKKGPTQGSVDDLALLTRIEMLDSQFVRLRGELEATRAELSAANDRIQKLETGEPRSLFPADTTDHRQTDEVPR